MKLKSDRLRLLRLKQTRGKRKRTRKTPAKLTGLQTSWPQERLLILWVAAGVAEEAAAVVIKEEGVGVVAVVAVIKEVAEVAANREEEEVEGSVADTERLMHLLERIH